MANCLGTLTCVLTAGVGCYLTFQFSPSYALGQISMSRFSEAKYYIGKLSDQHLVTVSDSSFILNTPVPQYCK